MSEWERRGGRIEERHAQMEVYGTPLGATDGASGHTPWCTGAHHATRTTGKGVRAFGLDRIAILGVREP